MSTHCCSARRTPDEVASLIIRLPEGKRKLLMDLARARKQSVAKLFDEMATVLIAEHDAEVRFRARAARGAGRTKRGLRLLAGTQGWAGVKGKR